ncbi:hypothetical protein CCP3SC1AL1_110021 [Gammaproteobacteria bacterium]
MKKVEITRTKTGEFSVIYPTGREVFTATRSGANLLARGSQERYAKKGITCEIVYSERPLETPEQKAERQEYTEATKGMDLRRKVEYNRLSKVEKVIAKFSRGRGFKDYKSGGGVFTKIKDIQRVVGIESAENAAAVFVYDGGEFYSVMSGEFGHQTADDFRLTLAKAGFSFEDYSHYALLIYDNKSDADKYVAQVEAYRATPKYKEAVRLENRSVAIQEGIMTAEEYDKCFPAPAAPVIKTYPEIRRTAGTSPAGTPCFFPDKCPVCGAPRLSFTDTSKAVGGLQSATYACGGAYTPKDQIQNHTDFWWGFCNEYHGVCDRATVPVSEGGTAPEAPAL